MTIIERLRDVCTESHIICNEAADLLESQAVRIAELEAERNNFHMEYRMKCDVETKQLHEELTALRAAIAEQEKAEPVAVLQTDYIGRFIECVYRGQILPADQWGWKEETRVSKGKFVPLYTHPAVNGGWQPIETAPRDGTRILVGGESPNGNSGYDAVGQAYWRKEIKYAEDSPRCDEPEGFYWASDNTRSGQCNWYVTHWMPLPAAPKPGENHD